MKNIYFTLFLTVLCFNYCFSDILSSVIKGTDINGLVNVISSLIDGLTKLIDNQSWALLLPKLLSVADNVIQTYFPPPTIPELDQNIWWGEGDHEKEDDESVLPYEIEFKTDRIQRLLHKLAHRENFTQPLKNAAMTYGMDSNFLNKVMDYWQHKYDFAKRQDRFNIYPQFTTKIQGLNIHFIHMKPKENKKVIPLLLLHGWPMTNMEYFKVIPKLMEKRKDMDFAFEIIAPTLPGFGYSEGTSKIGLAPYQIGIIFKNLMKRLGFNKFYIHGGDFGAAVGSDMTIMYQEDVLGFHTNFPFSFLPQTLIKYVLGALHPPAVVNPKYKDRMYPLSSMLYFIMTKFGYFHIHATFPDTVGISFTDSPSGLAAWILTIVPWATNPDNMSYNDGRILKTYDIDDLLDMLTIIWDSECITTSTRLYAEFTAVFQDPVTLKMLWSSTKVPYAPIKFLHEIIYQPDNFLRDKYKNLVHSTTVDFGGHLAAHENPRILADDIWKAMNKMSKLDD